MFYNFFVPTFKPLNRNVQSHWPYTLFGWHHWSVKLLNMNEHQESALNSTKISCYRNVFHFCSDHMKSLSLSVSCLFDKPLTELYCFCNMWELWTITYNKHGSMGPTHVEGEGHSQVPLQEQSRGVNNNIHMIQETNNPHMFLVYLPTFWYIYYYIHPLPYF